MSTTISGANARSCGATSVSRSLDAVTCCHAWQLAQLAAAVDHCDLVPESLEVVDDEPPDEPCSTDDEDAHVAIVGQQPVAAVRVSRVVLVKAGKVRRDMKD